MKFDLEKILIELGPYRERKSKLTPAQTALLVIDLQHFFSQIAQPILKNTMQVIQSCREKNIQVIFTQHGHVNPASDGGVLAEWWGEIIRYGTEDWKFLSEIKIESKDIIIPKKRYSAFFETDLDPMLRSKGIRNLIISGVMTNLCCETTARDAFMRDYRVFFLIDGTATRSTDLHLATLKNLGFGFAYLVTCNELINNLKAD